MKVGLIDVDGHHFPNLALMRISAWHKANGDDVEWWMGDLFHYDKVYMSKVFSDAYSPDIPEPINADEVIKFDNIEISHAKYELKICGKPVDIPPKELELLYFLASNCNRVFTRDQLLDKVWGFDYLGDSRTVDVHVKRLRDKLEGLSDKWALKTVWGVGYKFDVME